MKSLQEIINRNDYKNMNKALINRAIEVANIIREKMQYLDMDNGEDYSFENEIRDEIRLSVRSVYARSLNYSEEHLYISVRGVYGYESFALDTDKSYCVAGDFTARVRRASYNQFCKFLNFANLVLQQLDEQETLLVERGKLSLENSANIVE